MQTFPSRAQFQNDPAAASLLEAIESSQQLELTQALLYRSFPLYRDEEGGLVVPDCLILSQYHGVIALALTAAGSAPSKEEERRCEEIVEQVPSYIHSKLLRNRQLRKSPTLLSFEIHPLVYAPFLPAELDIFDPQVASPEALMQFLDDAKRDDPIDSDTFKELVATVDGAKGLIRPARRDLPPNKENSKGKQADLVEASITLFDQQQKHGMMGRITGPQRIRGLAGSGKTVVLAMKAAQTLLQNPTAKIAYTFSTKSLYQHVKRLITRFYRQFDDRDPDWERNLHVLHGWGGSGAPGLYSLACEKHGIPSISFQEAAASTMGDRFDYACSSLLKQTVITPCYDYIFVDEGQDFPMSFIRLCHALAKEGRFVLAYDDLQTIFQAVSPDSGQLFGIGENGEPKASFEEDVVLHKCYRNPREVLVAAHSVGFGIYGKRIVQMLESSEHWSDIGYVVRAGDFKAGSLTQIERPKENSLSIISDQGQFTDLVRATRYESVDEEVQNVADQISADIGDGLRPEDILVVAVDDRNAKTYLTKAEFALATRRIQCNNLHGDSFGIRDFTKDGRVTLSTVHKAKGNEAFMVYVIGCDAIMLEPNVRRRNMLFTAMTRAKGWVRVSGVGDFETLLINELNSAKSNFPFLVFSYPAPAQLKVMKRDLAESADRKLRAQRLIDQLQTEFTDEEIAEFLRVQKTRPAFKRKRHPERRYAATM